MDEIASQITSLTIAYSTVYSDTDQKKKTWKLRVTGFCVGNSPGTGEFPAQMASNAKNVSIWWHHHGSPANRIKNSSSTIFHRNSNSMEILFFSYFISNAVAFYKILYIARQLCKYHSSMVFRMRNTTKRKFRRIWITSYFSVKCITGPFALNILWTATGVTVIISHSPLREAVPSHAGPLSWPLFKQWNILLTFV